MMAKTSEANHIKVMQSCGKQCTTNDLHINLHLLFGNLKSTIKNHIAQSKEVLFKG